MTYDMDGGKDRASGPVRLQFFSCRKGSRNHAYLVGGGGPVSGVSWSPQKKHPDFTTICYPPYGHVKMYFPSYGRSMENGETKTKEKENGRLGSPVSQGSDSSTAQIVVKEGAADDAEAGCCGGGACAPETKPGWIVLNLILCIIAGIIFGWCLEKGRVFAASSIRLQMVFRRWVMLKMFLAAVGSGQLLIALLWVIPKTKPKIENAMAAFGCCFRDKGILTSALGPFILGVGMTLSGACPGMVLPQVGAWAKNAIFTFVGVLLGTLVYGMLAPFIVRITRPKDPIKTLTVHEKLKWPYIALAMPMAILIGIAVCLMEVFIPWQNDLDCWDRNYIATPVASNIFAQKSWPPGVAGAIIGVLQVFIVFAVGDTLGGSSAYVTLCSQWVVGKKLQATFPYLARARCGIGNWWQVFYVLAAVGGGAFSALSSNSIGTAQGPNIVTAIFGGICLLLGSRLAAGCTSGHGLSGMALLYWFSFIAVPAMFGGGIVTGYSMQATGALYDFECHAGHCWQIPLWNCTGFAMP